MEKCAQRDIYTHRLLHISSKRECEGRNEAHDVFSIHCELVINEWRSESLRNQKDQLGAEKETEFEMPKVHDEEGRKGSRNYWNIGSSQWQGDRKRSRNWKIGGPRCVRYISSPSANGGTGCPRQPICKPKPNEEGNVTVMILHAATSIYCQYIHKLRTSQVYSA